MTLVNRCYIIYYIIALLSLYHVLCVGGASIYFNRKLLLTAYIILLIVILIIIVFVKCIVLNKSFNAHISEVNFKEPPPLSLTLLSWSCKEDCSYICTWKAVESFVSHGLKVPQFHGKVSRNAANKAAFLHYYSIILILAVAIYPYVRMSRTCICFILNIKFLCALEDVSKV